jgi:hypothetical protein
MTVGGAYHPLSPTRILDTRYGIGGRTSPLGSHESWALTVGGANGVPIDAAAVVVNVTVTDTSAPSYLTVYPDGVERPNASNLNWVAGQTIPNLVEVKLGAGGRVDLYNLQGVADVVIDLEGWVGKPQPVANAAGLFQPVSPQRLLDTRDATGGWRTVGPGGTVRLQVAGRGGVPARGAAAAVMNVTVTNPTAASHLTVWPDGDARPNASNLNFLAGQTIPNRVMVKIGTTGMVDLYNLQGNVDIVVDVNGWFGDGTAPVAGQTSFTGVSPTRILDSRYGTGGWTTAMAPNSQRSLAVAGHGGVPPMSDGHPPSAVVLNVTVTNTTAPSYLTVWPDGEGRPGCSDLNWVKGVTIPNLVVVKLSPSGVIDLYNLSGQVDVVVDVVGYYS